METSTKAKGRGKGDASVSQEAAEVANKPPEAEAAWNTLSVTASKGSTPGILIFTLQD